MKTLVIYDQSDQRVKFFLVNEDWSKFNGIYINSYTDDITVELLQRELGDLLYDDQGNDKFEMSETTEVVEDKTKWNKVIICGFIA